MRYLTHLLAAAAVTLLPLGALAETGVADDRVTFVQIAALDGPAAQLGIGMRHGLLAAFAEANRNGGVHGRQLMLESRDDDGVFVLRIQKAG